MGVVEFLKQQAMIRFGDAQTMSQICMPFSSERSRWGDYYLPDQRNEFKGFGKPVMRNPKAMSEGRLPPLPIPAIKHPFGTYYSHQAVGRAASASPLVSASPLPEVKKMQMRTAASGLW